MSRQAMIQEKAWQLIRVLDVFKRAVDDKESDLVVAEARTNLDSCQLQLRRALELPEDGTQEAPLTPAAGSGGESDGG